MHTEPAGVAARAETAFRQERFQKLSSGSHFCKVRTVCQKPRRRFRDWMASASLQSLSITPSVTCSASTGVHSNCKLHRSRSIKNGISPRPVSNCLVFYSAALVLQCLVCMLRIRGLAWSTDWLPKTVLALVQAVLSRLCQPAAPHCCATCSTSEPAHQRRCRETLLHSAGAVCSCQHCIPG